MTIQLIEYPTGHWHLHAISILLQVWRWIKKGEKERKEAKSRVTYTTSNWPTNTLWWWRLHCGQTVQCNSTGKSRRSDTRSGCKWITPSGCYKDRRPDCSHEWSWRIQPTFQQHVHIPSGNKTHTSFCLNDSTPPWWTDLSPLPVTWYVPASKSLSTLPFLQCLATVTHNRHSQLKFTSTACNYWTATLFSAKPSAIPAWITDLFTVPCFQYHTPNCASFSPDRRNLLISSITIHFQEFLVLKRMGRVWKMLLSLFCDVTVHSFLWNIYSIHKNLSVTCVWFCLCKVRMSVFCALYNSPCPS